MVPHVWLTLDLDDQFNVHAFGSEEIARQYLNNHGYFEIRPGIYADSRGRHAIIKEVILHEY